jgi:hypothetical protein
MPKKDYYNQIGDECKMGDEISDISENENDSSENSNKDYGYGCNKCRNYVPGINMLCKDCYE